SDLEIPGRRRTLVARQCAAARAPCRARRSPIMAKDPVVHSSPAAIGSRLQVESVAGRLTVTTLGDKLTAAGVAAVAAVIDTYLNSTLSAAQRTALSATTGDNYVTISAGRVFVAVAP